MPIVMNIKMFERIDMYKDVLYMSEAIFQTSAKWLIKMQGKVQSLLNILYC